MLHNGQLPPCAYRVHNYVVMIDARPCETLLTQPTKRQAMPGVSLKAVVDIHLKRHDVNGSPSIILHASRTSLQIRAARALNEAGEGMPGPVTVRWSPDLKEDAMQVSWPGDQAVATLRIHYSLRVGTEYSGLYITGRSRRHVWVGSQCEPVGARRIMPCLDEPRFKSPFQVNVLAPLHWTVLSNSDEVRVEIQRPGAGRLVSFADTPPMSSYLLAIVLASPNALLADPDPFVTEDDVLVRVWRFPDDDPASLTAARAMAAGALNALGALTRQPYFMPKLDLVPVHAFDSAAMENWGCMIFHRDMLLVDVPDKGAEGPVADALHAVRLTVAHEVAHQWFGNLITMTWWHDLWLNEAFATLFGYWTLALHELVSLPWSHVLPAPPDALWVAALHAGHLPAWQHFLLDELPGALRGRAIMCPEATVASEADIESMFDGVTYARGAAVLRAMFLTLGSDLAPALRVYVLRATQHGGLATVEHLWAAVGASAAHVGASWLASGQLCIQGSDAALAALAAPAPLGPPPPALVYAPCQSNLVPVASGGATATSGFARPVGFNPLFAVPALVPMGPGTLFVFRALVTAPISPSRSVLRAAPLDLAAAVCVLLSAQHAVEVSGDPIGWGVVQEAAKNVSGQPLLQRAAKHMLRTWGSKCRRQQQADDSKDDHDARLRAMVAAHAAKTAATSAAAGKFALRSTLELCVRAVNGRAQLPAWKLLLETLAKPTGSRKAVLGVQEAQELFKELQRHAGAARHTCQPLMTRPLAAKTSGPPRFNTGGRRRCCGPPPPQSLCHV